jgi:hypothetical protein
MLTMIVMQTLNSIFHAGLYLYATTGQVPVSLSPAMVTGAFQSKK